VGHVGEGIELLTGQPSGIRESGGPYEEGSVLARAEETLRVYRRACLRAGARGAGRGGRP
jgi:hypothetical protein